MEDLVLLLWDQSLIATVEDFLNGEYNNWHI